MAAASVSAADAINTFNFSPNNPQIQNLAVTKESVVETLFLNCKVRINQVAQSINEITPDEVASLKDNDQHWKQEKKTKENLKENSWFGAFALLMTGAMSFYHLAAHFTILGPIIPIFQNIYNDTYTSRNGSPMSADLWRLLLSITISIMIIGAFVGGSTLKIMLTYFTRKHYLQLSNVVSIVGCLIFALIGALTGSYEAMIIGRFVIGLPVGIYYALIPLMLVEMSAQDKRAAWQSSSSIAIAFGLLSGPVLTHPKTLGTTQVWPVAIAITCIPSLMYLVASLWIPETPYYLVREGKIEEAMASLRKLRNGTDADLKRELNAIEAEVNKSTTVVGVKEMFTTKQYRRQFIAVAGVYAGFMLNGINNMLFYTDQIFISANIPSEHVTSATVGVFGFQFLFGFSGPKLVDYFGSLKVNKASTSILILSLILFTISQAAHDSAPDVMPYIAIVSVAIYLVGFFAGTQLATLVLLGELTTEPTRPTALALGSIVLWGLSWTIGFIPPYMAVGLGAYAMTVWIGASILFLIFQFAYLPDTKGKTVDEIQAHFM